MGSAQREVESRRFALRAPIGPIEAGELSLYRFIDALQAILSGSRDPAPDPGLHYSVAVELRLLLESLS